MNGADHEPPSLTARQAALVSNAQHALEESAARARARHPDQVGLYKITGILGRGGMGIVYLAEQDKPRRAVALKLLRPEISTPASLRRFEHESQILGRLQHPGIARIYEAGIVQTEYGPQPFLAMECIAGRNLIEYSENNALSTKQQLELLADVCDAVHHAHQKGVIHRDLKPANILVDEFGRAKILDFGVARILDSDEQLSTLDTGTGHLLGTLPYMSPEQVHGDCGAADSRSDVYALGVIGYTLLSGRWPYELSRKPLAEAARIIREQDPAPLSTGDRQLAGDIEAIISKALEKDAARRYQSAAELAADIRRQLHDEPITAHPPSALYVLRKFARRHRAAVFGVSAVFIVVVVGFISTALGWYHAIQQQNRALQAESRAEARRVESDTIARLLIDMLAAPDPNRRKGANYTVRALLDDFSEKLDDQLQDQPEIEAGIRATIGNSYRMLALDEVAAPHLRRVLEIRRQLPDAERLANALGNFATLLGDQRLVPQAAAFYEEALRILQERPGGDRLPMRDQAAQTSEWGGIPDILSELAQLYCLMGDPRAETCAQQAVDMTRRMLGDDHPRLAEHLCSLGWVLRERGRAAEAVPLLREALAISRSVDDGSPTTLNLLMELGLVLVGFEQREQAAPLLREALASTRRTYGGEHPNVAACLFRLLDVLRVEDAEAEPLMREALTICEKVYGREHEHVARALGHLAVVVRCQKRIDEAEGLYREALEVGRQVLGDEHPAVSESRISLAVLLWEEKQDYMGAEVLLRQSLADHRAFFGGDAHPSVAIAMGNLGGVLYQQGRFAEAEPLVASAMAALRQADMAQSFRMGSYLALYGRCLAKLDRLPEAETHLLQAWEILKASGCGPHHARTIYAIAGLVELYESWGRRREAERFQAMLPPPWP